ncbi:MAG: ATP-binding protein [Myxococcota bacterium]
MEGATASGDAPAGIETPKQVSAARRWLLRGLGARLVLAQLLVAFTLLAFAAIAQRELEEAQTRIEGVYEHRVVPLRKLWLLLDHFAVDFVDAVHKVADGSLSPKAGAERLRRVSQTAEVGFREAEARMTSPLARAELHTLRPLLSRAQESLTEALGMMSREDVEGLARWRRTELYSRVDPLTAGLQRKLGRDVAAAHGDVTDLRMDLTTAARRSVFWLALSGLFAVAVGVFVALRFVSSLQRIAHVAQSATAGHLEARVNLAGHDELSEMAGHVDHMIEAIERSQRELSMQSEQLRESEAEARAANVAKSAFLSNVSHELRTPLNVILGYVQVLERDANAPANHRRGLERIREAGNHLLELVEDLLGVTRAEAGELKLRHSVFSPLGLLQELQRMLGASARNKGLDFEVTVKGELPSAVLADRRRLFQILLNLTSNAIKFTSKGSVSICARYDDGKLHIEVKDTGPGISREEQTELFRTFAQGSLGERSGEGTGLGLFISRTLVRVMGGEIALQSELGSGSTFAFSVIAPLAESSELARGQANERRLAPGATLAPMLVVDDREANREVLRALLESAGIEVVEAENGRVALAKLRAQPTSLVWLDLKMPELDGFATLQAIRAEPALQTLPVVAITASAVDVDEARASELGFDALVVKPFRAHAIFDLVERVLPGVLADAGVASDTSASETVDVAGLSLESRARLLRLLELGEVQQASELVGSLGAEFGALKAEIDAFRTDALLAKLRVLARES